MTTTKRSAPLGARVDAQKIMEQMQKLVRASLTSPIVWETARAIVADVAARHEDEQATVIRQWLVEHLRFVNDPVATQLLTAPEYLLEKITADGYVLGNCADAAMLAAALCEAIRIRCNFVAVAFGHDHANYSHVFTMAYPHTAYGAKAAVEFDVTRPPGLPRANFTRHLEYPA